MALVYNVNDNATQVLVAHQMKDNIFMDLFHKNGKGITEKHEVNASSVRIFKVLQLDGDARKLGEEVNGGFFNNEAVGDAQVIEYDLPLLYVYDKMLDLPEVQQDIVAVDILEGSLKNISGRVSLEINACTFATQLAKKINTVGNMATPAWANNAVIIAGTAGKKNHYNAVMSASGILDDGDEENGIASYPFNERQLFVTSSLRQSLMSDTGVILGGSNFAQSMLAKGGIDPEAQKEFGSMYVGEIDNIPCYLVPKPVWNRTKIWLDSADTTKLSKANLTTLLGALEGLMVSAIGTDRGISTPDYVKIIDSPNGAGKRLQPKTRWGVEACYASSIVPIFANGTSVLPTTSTSDVVKLVAPGNVSKVGD